MFLDKATTETMDASRVNSTQVLVSTTIITSINSVNQIPISSDCAEMVDVVCCKPAFSYSLVFYIYFAFSKVFTQTAAISLSFFLLKFLIFGQNNNGNNNNLCYANEFNSNWQCQNKNSQCQANNQIGTCRSSVCCLPWVNFAVLFKFEMYFWQIRLYYIFCRIFYLKSTS